MQRYIEKLIERRLNKTITEIRNTTIAQNRIEIEERTGKPTKFKSWWPLIGRGSVMADRAKSNEEVEKSFLLAIQE